METGGSFWAANRKSENVVSTYSAPCMERGDHWWCQPRHYSVGMEKPLHLNNIRDNFRNGFAERADMSAAPHLDATEVDLRSFV